ncbi:AAC(3) family N-acetyltransferase [Halobacteria archaeon AArc-curdl1]|uniref:AAC(3) family N-acetyltransferase n=1 Tax=Natronosalvus hydrolyticus TaxID=2979988 RepID=A0AAP2Z982_9EURY|nr:AAC(3) family N-acetyltransferase [Halobacteria archaeon AArc-curdl1]
MAEADAIAAVDEPVTVTSLVDDLRDLGLSRGDVVLVHASLQELGWVCVDAQAVVDALMRTVTPEGTLVMPTHSAQYSDPGDWSNPPVPESWVETVREERPPYRPETTPTRGMGAIAECFRTYPDVQRSAHPVYSFAAWGQEANSIVADHAFDDGLGERSPLSRVYDHDGSVLLLGVDYEPNTSLHLAESRADIDLPSFETSAPVLENGERVLRRYVDLEYDDSDFGTIGEAFEAAHEVRRGTVGAATTITFSQPEMVDFGIEWLEEHRG